MDFTDRKLPIEVAPTMRVCMVRSVQPYALMLSPVYVFMQLNEKFVSVKAPLDFFSPEELARLKPFMQFFMPEFVDRPLVYREAATKIRALMSWQSVRGVELGPVSFELSDAVLRLLGPLWSKSLKVEPFFVAVFTNEICDLLPGDLLISAREKDVRLYERAIFASSWSVFLALMLGYCDRGFLNGIRRKVFDHAIEQTAPAAPGEIEELIRVSLGDPLDEIARGRTWVVQKINSRLKRVQSQFARPESELPTIYGEKGFVRG